MKYDENFLDACFKLGKRIKEQREKRQITIKELSEKTGIRAEYLKKIENGKATGIRFSHIFIIAHALKTKAYKLCEM